MFLSWFKRPARKPRRFRHHRLLRFRPWLEYLEDRTVLSLFTATGFPVGNNPVSQAVGDFNGDGHADLAVINQNSNTVSVLLGNGNGSFGPKTDYATGITPTSVVAGDFNGDGKLDLAAANFGSKSVSILLGNGDGTFKPRTDIALTTAPVSLAAGDFSGDGKLDLAVATEDLSNDYVNILRGNGDGTFQAPTGCNENNAPCISPSPPPCIRVVSTGPVIQSLPYTSPIPLSCETSPQFMCESKARGLYVPVSTFISPA